MKFHSEDIIKYKNLLSRLNEGATTAETINIQTMISNLPKIALSTKLGKSSEGNVDRKSAEIIFKKFTSSTGTPIQKIESIVKKINDLSTNSSDDISTVFSSLLLLDTMSRILHNFNASSGGSIWEAFFSVIVGGEITDTSLTEGEIKQPLVIHEDGSVVSKHLLNEKELPIVDVTVGGVAYSVKLIKQSVNVNGSVINLINHLAQPKSITYLVAYKGNGIITFYNKTITDENFYDFLAKSANNGNDLFKLPNNVTITLDKVREDYKTITDLNTALSAKKIIISKSKSKFNLTKVRFLEFSPGENTKVEFDVSLENMSKIATDNIQLISEKIGPVYENLSTFTASLTSFLMEENENDRKQIGIKASSDAKELQSSTVSITGVK